LKQFSFSRESLSKYPFYEPLKRANLNVTVLEASDFVPDYKRGTRRYSRLHLIQGGVDVYVALLLCNGMNQQMGLKQKTPVVKKCIVPYWDRGTKH